MFILWISDSGVSLENGIFVAAVVPGSPAAKEGSLTVGDRIIAVSLNTFLICIYLFIFDLQAPVKQNVITMEVQLHKV